MRCYLRLGTEQCLANFVTVWPPARICPRVPEARSRNLGTLSRSARGFAGAAHENRDRLYVATQGQRIVILRIFVKKTEKTPRNEIDLALSRMKLIQPEAKK